MAKIIRDYLDILTENLLKTLNTPDAYLNKIALSAVTLIIALLINAGLKNLINKNVKNLGKNYKLKKALKNILITVVVVFILFIWIRAINALILIALAAGALIVIMLRGLIHNIIGYFVIKYYKHFKKGHRIEINGTIGDVIGMNPVSFQLLEVRNWLSSDTTTGRVIKMPNSIIFEHSVEMVGLDNEFIWQEIKYILSFDSSWKDAEKIMTDASNKHFHESILPNLRGNDRLLLTMKKY
ncbi:MAG: mechanosensitive ion channel [Clostridium sp.]|nr:mechanosensitive ion channel [Clostridium sp.]